MLAFSSNKTRKEIAGKSHAFYWKNTNKGEMGNAKRGKSSICFTLAWKKRANTTAQKNEVFH